MGDRLVQVAEDFWNIRGTFRVGPIDIGTQASLVRRPSGRFVMLDAYTLQGEVEREVLGLTDGGQAIEAVINLHPFHTIHCKRVNGQLPHARLVGTARHAAKAPGLPWDALTSDDPALHAEYADVLEFSVPRGVELIPANEALHFASVLAYHRASRTLHVDDTLSYLKLPGVARLVGWPDVLAFPPTLGQVLEKRAGAAADFRAWVEETLQRWGDAAHLCTAHAAILSPKEGEDPIRDRILAAYDRVKRTLTSHERTYG